MSIGTVMSQNSPHANRRLPVGRSAAAAGRNRTPRRNAEASPLVSRLQCLRDGGPAVNAAKEREVRAAAGDLGAART